MNVLAVNNKHVISVKWVYSRLVSIKRSVILTCGDSGRTVAFTLYIMGIKTFRKIC